MVSGIKKIVAIGPESTGKSTLCALLAEELQTQWVPEYAREYLDKLDRPYEESDLLHIAKGQVALEDKLLLSAHKFLLCDTDLYVMKVWSEYKYNSCPAWIMEEIARRKYDLYLLTYPDIEWTPDPLREFPDLAMRKYFYNIYLDIVQNSGVPWVVIKGTYAERQQSALQAITSL